MRDPREHFALANRHVVEADERVADQRRRIEEQREAGRDTGRSEELLRVLLQTRELMVAHQKLLEREMAECYTLNTSHGSWVRASRFAQNRAHAKRSPDVGGVCDQHGRGVRGWCDERECENRDFKKTVLSVA